VHFGQKRACDDIWWPHCVQVIKAIVSPNPQIDVASVWQDGFPDFAGS
jgi:hypothetical protein